MKGSKLRGHRLGARALAGCLTLGMALSASLAGAAGPAVIVAESRLQAVVEELRVSGTVTAPRSARLSPEVAGKVAALRVDVGSRVSKNEILVELDAELARLDLEVAQAAVAQASEALADARRREADGRRLASARSLSASAHEALQSEVRADAALLRQREAERRGAQARLERHVLRAPFDGVISAKLTELGEWIAPGDEALALVAERGLWVDLQVPQAYFPRLDPKVPVQLRLDALPDEALEARIERIVPVSDASARSFLLRVGIVRDGLPMTPGMSASAVLRLDAGRERVVVARDALLRHVDGRVTVWVVEAAGAQTQVVERVVRPGLGFDGMVEIVDGLEAGLRVVVEGNESLRPGQAVTVAGAR
ncbi:efflux RND transporter periplasmic adaptor subunit [Denitromonas iodatirespirans]|uniref:Efflux RND transporter periplasmic adaptor subunit n=1 Tax=Denitromonas iodatirespirans TaxID=2795389 RepID=A0A944H883_DENI1|nr:efflux RND transporter periplasmic adaptor subunit [Denitromonas iodatirespirans]MBT0962018.1 efflux RND transporter periplasmic adaptor subunit [Denitromonas iodatirespirans]